MATVGTLVASALGMAGEAIVKGAVGEAVKDSYKALKGKIAHWAGHDVEALEKAPTSAARQAVVAEIIDAQPADDLAAVRALAERLIAALKATGSTGLDLARLEALEVRLGAITVKGGTGVRMGDVRVHGTFGTGDIKVGDTPGKTSEPEKAEDAASEAASIAGSLVPATERQINIWIGDGDVGLKQALKIGQTYRLNFRVGQPVSNSSISGAAAAVSSKDVPKGGLPTDWLVVARSVELAAGTADTEVSVGAVGGVSTWSGRFKLLIPEEGDSPKRQLKITLQD